MDEQEGGTTFEGLLINIADSLHELELELNALSWTLPNSERLYQRMTDLRSWQRSLRFVADKLPKEYPFKE